MLVAWGWKDFVAQLITWADDEYFPKILIALVLSVLISLITLAPWYHRAVQGLATNGATSPLLYYYLALPSSLSLALGFAWNAVATHYVGMLQDTLKGRHVRFQFLIQLAYFVVIAAIIVHVTSWFSRATAGSKSSNDHSLNLASADLHVHLAHVEMQGAKPLVQALSFVYAWALLNTLDDLVFGLILKCGSPTKCSFQNNLAYAFFITTGFILIDQNLKGDPAQDKVTRSVEKSLRVTAMFLTCGWAWMNFLEVFVDFSNRSRREAGVSYLLLLVVYGILVSLFYHAVLTQKRAWDKQRKCDEKADSFKALSLNGHA
jgi:hypothetical protein